MPHVLHLLCDLLGMEGDTATAIKVLEHAPCSLAFVVIIISGDSCRFCKILSAASETASLTESMGIVGCSGIAGACWISVKFNPGGSVIFLIASAWLSEADAVLAGGSTPRTGPEGSAMKPSNTTM